MFRQECHALLVFAGPPLTRRRFAMTQRLRLSGCARPRGRNRGVGPRGLRRCLKMRRSSVPSDLTSPMAAETPVTFMNERRGNLLRVRPLTAWSDVGSDLSRALRVGSNSEALISGDLSGCKRDAGGNGDPYRWSRCSEIDASRSCPGGCQVTRDHAADALAHRASREPREHSSGILIANHAEAPTDWHFGVVVRSRPRSEHEGRRAKRDRSCGSGCWRCVRGHRPARPSVVAGDRWRWCPSGRRRCRGRGRCR